MTHVLLGEWGFLDNLDDTSGNARHASANFTPSYIDGPVAGTRAIRFSAAGQTVTYGRTGLEPPASAGGVCMMAWVKLFSSNFGYTGIIRKTRATDSTKHAIDVKDNTVFWMDRWREQLNFAESGTYLSDLGWHHLCNVDADDRWARFVDGVLIASGARTGTSPVVWEDFPWLSGEAAAMSNYDSTVNVAFTGVRLFSGTLSNVEVATWMNTDIVPEGRSGKPKTWSGSAWNPHQAKAWNGSSWVPVPMSGYDGSDFVPSK